MVTANNSRLVRRHAAFVEGTLTMHDGSVRPIDEQVLLEPIERALRWMSYAVIALAMALLAARVWS